ncbi:hypothetical protein FNV43_RR20322 [Rhamnella rubrinervis]|uniref:Uncharacterized protein n=1 Tax=Rhamnella rubrinervis TaxID=2594499 RepID=A0A8K0DZH2_9ROSA|nr:hypothetical protein FNV43_RR20322 [Rhamnella rubrinervis]
MARASDHLLAASDTLIHRNTSGDPNAQRCLCFNLLGCLGPSDSGQRTRDVDMFDLVLIYNGVSVIALKRDPKHQQKVYSFSHASFSFWVENTITYKETFIDDRLLPIYIDTSRGTQSTPP